MGTGTSVAKALARSGGLPSPNENDDGEGTTATAGGGQHGRTGAAVAENNHEIEKKDSSRRSFAIAARRRAEEATRERAKRLEAEDAAVKALAAEEEREEESRNAFLATQAGTSDAKATISLVPLGTWAVMTWAERSSYLAEAKGAGEEGKSSSVAEAWVRRPELGNRLAELKGISDREAQQLVMKMNPTVKPPLVALLPHPDAWGRMTWAERAAYLGCWRSGGRCGGQNAQAKKEEGLSFLENRAREVAREAVLPMPPLPMPPFREALERATKYAKELRQRGAACAPILAAVEVACHGSAELPADLVASFLFPWGSRGAQLAPCLKKLEAAVAGEARRAETETRRIIFTLETTTTTTTTTTTGAAPFDEQIQQQIIPRAQELVKVLRLVGKTSLAEELATWTQKMETKQLVEEAMRLLKAPWHASGGEKTRTDKADWEKAKAVEARLQKMCTDDPSEHEALRAELSAAIRAFKPPPEPEMIRCPWCGKQFEADTGRQGFSFGGKKPTNSKFCSDDCYESDYDFMKGWDSD